MSMWKRDGSGWRARIGVLSHEDLTVSESEFWTIAPRGGLRSYGACALS